MTKIEHLAHALDKLKVTRRFGFFFTMWLTWISVDYSFALVHAALESNAPSLDIAAIVAAILVPVTGLQGAVINFYHKHGTH